MTSSGGHTAVVVVNYGPTGLLERNLVPLAAARPDVRVVVVDNRTTGENADDVARICAAHGWRAVLSPTNLGFGGGMNAGVSTALDDGAGRVLLLNPDAVVDDSALAALERAVENSPMTAVSPRVVTTSGAVWFAGAGLDVRDGTMVGPERLGEAGIEPWLSGACLMLSATLWRAVGGFDDSYFLYWEDVDLSRRIREAGGALRVLEDVTAVHDEGSTHGEGGARAKSDLYYYYNVRNRLRYAQAHLTPAARRRWQAGSLLQAREVLLRGGRRQFVRSRSGLWAALAGVRDGLSRRWGPRGAPGVSASSAGTEGPLRVLMTYIEPLPFHNPYVKLHDRSLEETGEVRVLHFTWRTALRGDYDVVHSHWPEDVFAATTPLKAAGKRVAAAAWLAVLAAKRIPIVRTVHNLALPSGMDPVKKALILAMDRMTTSRVLISATTPTPEGPHSTVLHGHYRDWFGVLPVEESVPGRIAYFGMVRRYKNVEALASAFAETRDTHPEWTLEIAGKASSPELEDDITRILDHDVRARTTFRYLDDEEVVRVCTQAALVVLPYKEMHNSGSLLTALSLGRPALVPRNEANEAVAAEVGPAWVQMYEGELDADDLVRAMAAVADLPGTMPDLRGRDWDVSAAGHLAAYRDALSRRHRRVPGRAYSS
ncbi:glycosyltransferase [Mobilicoccus massiliensis]|uniref:glycosyltransferase n=1 Tax=Mobilicoccus massiliensis TaxID=1522310 RepID=UPI0009E46DFE|nr:glycosyltransferase [Mobilicoccus massiliensis]